MSNKIANGFESVVARNRPAALAVGLAVSLLAQHAASAEAPQVQKVPVAAELVVDSQFRTAIDAYIREQSRQLREALNEDLRRELSEKIVLSTNELRTRT